MLPLKQNVFDIFECDLIFPNIVVDTINCPRSLNKYASVITSDMCEDGLHHKLSTIIIIRFLDTFGAEALCPWRSAKGSPVDHSPVYSLWLWLPKLWCDWSCVNRESHVLAGLSYELPARVSQSVYPTLSTLLASLVRPVEEVIELGRRRHLRNSSDCLFIYLLIGVTGIGSSWIQYVDWLGVGGLSFL